MDLSLTLLEVPARFGEVHHQLDWIVTTLDSKPPAEVLVLPEAALTGYVTAEGDFDLSRFGEPLEGRQTSALRDLARRYRCTVVGPLIERDGDRCFNTQLVVAPSGEIQAHYRKRHPWYPETWATPGDLPWPSFTVRGLSCTLAICFDVHFLADEAGEVLRDSDVLVFCSAWVDSDGDARPGHLRPLATGFDLFIANANWGPGTPAMAGQGGSMLVSPDGVVVARTQPGASRLDVLVPSR